MIALAVLPLAAGAGPRVADAGRAFAALARSKGRWPAFGAMAVPGPIGPVGELRGMIAHDAVAILGAARRAHFPRVWSWDGRRYRSTVLDVGMR